MHRLLIPDEQDGVFGAHARGNKNVPHWPTLRGGFIDDVSIQALRQCSDLIFLTGEYQTNLNKYVASASNIEKAVFGESQYHLPMQPPNPSRGYPVYLLWWLGNYYNGSVFHCAWQFPHYKAFRSKDLLRYAIRHFELVVLAVYDARGVERDADVAKFLQKAKAYVTGN